MPECERCGKKAKLTLVKIDRAEMYVCPDCIRFGKRVERKKETPGPAPGPRARKSSPRPKKPDALSRRDRELAEDYPSRIRRARERMGLSREELGKKLNERVSVISKLEQGHMHPSDKLIKKLQKTLDITLMEEVEDYKLSSSAESGGMTLADFIVEKK